MICVRTTAADRIEELRSGPVPVGAKGWPAAAEGRPLDEVADGRWRVLDGDLPLPALVLRERALHGNVETMAAWCEAAGVLLAPHGKTTMAPQLFERQLAAGAWAITAATPVHARVYRHFGVPRILLANQLVERQAIAWAAAELNADPSFDLLCLVDSIAGVELLADGLREAGARRPLDVLLEIGVEGGRTGVRSPEQALAVAHAIAQSTELRLVGVEGFEGLLASTSAATELPRVEAFLDGMQAALERLDAAGAFSDCEQVLLTAGGSAFFDRVVARFSALAPGGRPPRIVLRSGAYVTQDDGVYRALSALGDRAPAGAPRLHNAIEVWSAVLSRPEPDLAIAGMGKRDAPNDIAPPTPVLACAPGDAAPRPLAGRVEALTDQHAHLRIDPRDPLAVGDLLCCTISHPCTAFDRWRLIPVVDDDHRVVGGLHTFF